MSSQTDDSNSASTLPREELNPLVNPLLAQNMGRWAEVYFTNLPENREQAVLDLLYELRAEASQPEPAAHPNVKPQVPLGSGVSRSLDSSPTFVRCPQCGYENRSDHNFCGSCRAELKSAEAFFDALTPKIPALEAEQSEDSRIEGSRFEAPRFEAARPETPPRELPSLPPDTERAELDRFDQREIDRLRFEQTKWKLDESAGERQFKDRSSAVQNEPELFRFSNPSQSRKSYRVYAGVVLAIVTLILVYRTWWSGPTTGGISTAVQQPLPSSATGTANSPSAAAMPKQVSPAPATSRPSATSTLPAVSAADSASLRKSSAGLPGTVHDASPTGQPPATQSSAATDVGDLPVWGNGGTELSLAKNFLSGSGGKERNSAEAAALLWKAVGKKNAEAAELLSDLYLKGDGVVKNCDQARILLDAAARKGRKDAGARLAHLEAFGCQ